MLIQTNQLQKVFTIAKNVKNAGTPLAAVTDVPNQIFVQIPVVRLLLLPIFPLCQSILS